MPFYIAVDGLASSGKSTICNLVAKNLGFWFISSGFVYRIFGYILAQKHLLDSEFSYQEKELLKNEINFADDKWFLNKIDVTNIIKQAEVSFFASKIAQVKPIRNLVNNYLKTLILHFDKVIMDGRDITSKVLPDANLKLFFKANALIRAQRRTKELAQLNNQKPSFWKIFWEIIKRDYADKHRKIDPLVLTKDTHVINTSFKTIDQVFQSVKKLIQL